MTNVEKEKLIRSDILSIENRVRHAFNQGYVLGYKDGLQKNIKALPSVNPQPKTWHCKDCKHFEYDKVARVDGIPLIVAHEICNKWGDGCKTNEDGYCFLFEPQERSDKE